MIGWDIDESGTICMTDSDVFYKMIKVLKRTMKVGVIYFSAATIMILPKASLLVDTVCKIFFNIVGGLFTQSVPI